MERTVFGGIAGGVAKGLLLLQIADVAPRGLASLVRENSAVSPWELACRNEDISILPLLTTRHCETVLSCV